MLINDLNILENMFHNITIYTDDRKLKDNVPSSLECVDCDVRKDFRVIYSMGTVMAIKRHNKEVDDILHDIMSVVDSISLKSKNFIISYNLYPFDIMVSYNESDKKFLKTLRKKVDHSDEDVEILKIAPTGVGRFAMLSGGQAVIRITKQEDKDKLIFIFSLS